MRRPALGPAYWSRRLAGWPAEPPEREPGYTLLVPVPGDIPVFLDLALRVCRTQDSPNRVRTIVVPDRPSPHIRRIVDSLRPGWPDPIEVLLLPAPERWFLPHMKSGSRNHGLQVVAGIGATTSTHIVLHDADLFLLADDLLESQYRSCVDRDLACLGVSPAWDPWYAEHGLRLAATWELVASVEWLRRHTPYRQIGHDEELFGERHTFDTTLYAQAVSPPEQVDWVDRSGEFVHFNYAITTYRHYQRHGPGFLDRGFRLLLIALFVELFGSGARPDDLPSLAELSRGIDATTAPVLYPNDEAASIRWRETRADLHRVLTSHLVDRHSATRANEALAPFDAFYGWEVDHPVQPGT